MTSILLELEQGELVACLACRKLLLRPASMLGEDCILVFSEAINRGFKTWISAISHCDHGVTPEPTSFRPPYWRSAECPLKFLGAHFRQPVECRVHQPIARLKFCRSPRRRPAIPWTHILADVASKDMSTHCAPNFFRNH